MILKFIFDRLVALIGLLFLWPVLLIVAVLVKVKMPTCVLCAEACGQGRQAVQLP